MEKWEFLKHPDDTVIVSDLNGNETIHGPKINNFIKWFAEYFLQWNLSKTKNKIIDFTHVKLHQLKVRKENLCKPTNILLVYLESVNQ